jgi:hypothetical protein
LVLFSLEASICGSKSQTMVIRLGKCAVLVWSSIRNSLIEEFAYTQVGFQTTSIMVSVFCHLLVFFFK